jgi:hypothetical protein
MAPLDLYRNFEIEMMARDPETAALFEERIFDPGHRPLEPRQGAERRPAARRVVGLEQARVLPLAPPHAAQGRLHCSSDEHGAGDDREPNSQPELPPMASPSSTWARIAA